MNLDVKHVLEALDVIKEWGTGYYLENICEVYKNKFGWDEKKTKLALKKDEKSPEKKTEEREKSQSFETD